MNKFDFIFEQIEHRITNLQRAHLDLEAQLKQERIGLERHTNDAALRVIDILDMIDTIESNPCVSDASGSIDRLIIKKIVKRLADLLKRWQVTEIDLNEARLEEGKIRVLEVQATTSEAPAGAILKICRKGYQRANKIIRAADVILS